MSTKGKVLLSRVIHIFCTSTAALAACLLITPPVSGQTAPTITLQPVSQAVPTGSNATFTVGVSGTGPFTYQWVQNGTIKTPQAPAIITPVAGMGSVNGDGGAATNTLLANPKDLVVDSVGNLYIAETDGPRIRKIDTNGIISTVAGKGRSFGYSGDGGAATNALLVAPAGVALDKMGNLFIVDISNSSIRKVDTNGIISTMLSNAPPGWINAPGIAVDEAGNLYFSAPNFNRVFKVFTNGISTLVAGNGISSFSGDGATATNASLKSPSFVAVDGMGNLYIADSGNSRVRKVDPNGIITTVAGKGIPFGSGDGGQATNAGLMTISGMTIDGSGNLYIAGGNSVRKVAPNGLITTAVTIISSPSAITADISGNLFIIQSVNSRIYKVFNDPTLKLTNVTADATYSVIVSNAFGSVTSSVVTLSVGNAPSILTAPTTQRVPVGGSTIINAWVNGTGPLSYQWQQNGTDLSNGLRISGVDTAVLRITNLAASDAGNYALVVTNAFGQITRTIATLVVIDPPVVIKQPTSQVTPVGMPANFGVEVSGSGPFTYQWLHNGTNLSQSVITTVAGGYFADNCAAVHANLSSPQGVAVDSGGNMFIVDAANYRIRMVDSSGMITTIAGNGTSGFSGDGGPATSASIAPQSGIAVDSEGNIYFADTLNNRIRKVDTNGIITTVAGNGTIGSLSGEVQATQTSVPSPFGVAVDTSGNLYITDCINFSIRKVSTDGIITTIAYGYPNLFLSYGVAVDTTGNVYIADSLHSRICKINTNGLLTTVAGNGTGGYSGDGGAATNAGLMACDLTTDRAGNIFLADHNRIRKVDTNGIITTVAGNGSDTYFSDGVAATNSSLTPYMGIAVDNYGNLFVPDRNNNRIRKVDVNGIITTVAGNGNVGDGKAVTTSSLAAPTSAIMDNAGNLYIADSRNHRIRKVDTNGIIATVAGNGIPSYSGDGDFGTNASLYSPAGLAIDSSGNLYIADSGNRRIRKLGINGIITTVAGNGEFPSLFPNFPIFNGDGKAATMVPLFCDGGLTMDTGGNLYISDSSSHQIRKVGTNGIISTVAGKGYGYAGYSGDGIHATNATLNFPKNITFSKYNELFIADSGNNRIRTIHSDGIESFIFTVAGNGNSGFSGDFGPATNAKLSSPSGIAIDKEYNRYIGDSLNNRVRKVDTNGTITTIAGKGTRGYSGDGGAAANAGLSAYGLAIDGSGNLLIADTQNNRIRKVTFAALPTWTIPSAGVQDAGNYSVVISNSFGSITSSVVSLLLTETAPVINDTAFTDQIVMAGASTTLSANASGSLLSYQWLFNGNVMANATNTFLTLRNVTTNQSGLYSVIVSNTISSASRDVQLLVIPAVKPELAPQLASSALQSGKFNLHFSTLPGYRYIVQCSDSLTATNWTTIKTLPAEFTPGSINVLTDVTNAAQFYRVIIAN